MDTTDEIIKPKIPEILTARLPEEIKGDLADLMLLEKRRVSDMSIRLMEEAIPIKKKIHDHKHQLMPIYRNSIDVMRTQRVALDGPEGDYKMRPGLLLSFNGSGFILSKEEALVMAANLSIFLNEVNI